jgi:hypothetical protein
MKHLRIDTNVPRRPNLQKADDDDVFCKFLQKQKKEPSSIYLKEYTYHKRLFRPEDPFRSYSAQIRILRNSQSHGTVAGGHGAKTSKKISGKGESYGPVLPTEH